MNKFWKWMEKKGYVKWLDGSPMLDHKYMAWGHEKDQWVSKPSEQMLIGYMIEYLREVKGKIIFTAGGRAEIGDVYESYVKQIDKI